jgi:hypothetical protein
LHQQLQYVLAALLCGSRSNARLWIVCGVALAILAACGLLSFIALRSFAAEKHSAGEDRFRARHFLAGIGIMGAVLFLFAVLLQLAALFYLPLCTG